MWGRLAELALQVLGDPALSAQYYKECASMATRIKARYRRDIGEMQARYRGDVVRLDGNAHQGETRSEPSPNPHPIPPNPIPNPRPSRRCARCWLRRSRRRAP